MTTLQRDELDGVLEVLNMAIDLCGPKPRWVELRNHVAAMRDSASNIPYCLECGSDAFIENGVCDPCSRRLDLEAETIRWSAPL